MSTAKTYAIIEAPDDSAFGYKGYGAAYAFWCYKGPEVVLDGPYQTGKTIGALNKLHALCAKYPGARALMVRRTYSSLKHTAVVSYENKVLPYPPHHPKCGVVPIGGNSPERYVYPNRSTITLGGLDNPAKFLSGEYDYIYVNQLEELPLDSYELLTGRATGRAGNVPYPQVMSDCNPDKPTHWILQRERLKRFKSKHEDNPTLYDPDTGAQTALGATTMTALDALTGVRLKRGRHGLWVGVEGMVYEDFDNTVHLIDRFDIPASWRRICSIDFGYTNPYTAQYWAIDEDGRMYLYRELYKTQTTVRDHATQMKALLQKDERISAYIADHDAEDRATLRQNGIETIAADKRIKVGIEAVQFRLKTQGDGKARLFVLRDSLVERDAALALRFKPTSVVDEFPAYAWQPTNDSRAAKEEPIDVDNHGLDALRYAAMYLDGDQGTIKIGKVDFYASRRR